MVAIPQFDSRLHEPMSGYQPLPAGWYAAIIVGSEIIDTRDKTGRMLVLERRVMDCADRSLVGKTFLERLNVVNASGPAMEIAQRKLSSICHVTGVFVVNDTAQLHNIPHRVELTVRFDDKDPTKAIGNEIINYADQHGNGPGKSGGGQPMPGPAGSHSGVAAAQPMQQQQPAQPAPQPQQPAPQPGTAAAWGGTPAPVAQPAPPAQQPPPMPAAAWGGQPAPVANGAAPAAWATPAAQGGAAAAPAAWGNPAGR